MKSKRYILVFISAVFALPVLAGDGGTTRSPSFQRLQEIDLSLAMRQYERVSMDAFEARLQLDLLDTDNGMSMAVRKHQADLLARRYELLQQRAHDLASKVVELGD